MSGPGGKDDALAAAMRLIGYRPRTTRELETRLADKGFCDNDIAEVVAHLTETGLLDDERYARDLAESRIRNKRWGPARIRADLKKRMVPPELIDRILGEIDPETVAETAREALAAWAAKERLPLPPEGDDFGRAARMLERRGFPTYLAVETIKESGVSGGSGG